MMPRAHGLVPPPHQWILVVVCLIVLAFSSASAAQTPSIWIPAPRTTTDPRAKLVEDLRKYFRNPKHRVRVVDARADAQFLVEVKRPYVTGSAVPYVQSGAGDDRITAAAVHVAAARICERDTERCVDLTASAKVNEMATMQLADKIATFVNMDRPH